VPTGIITVEMSRASKSMPSGQVCPRCMHEGHDTDAVYCKICGARLNE
jgi:voltage-gated potassium channel